ncbi:MAG: hybrid sensor histidine kinase/response regulator [Victivallales bacterium]|nr:hybrid sensor histidine kinase/response regulator [Victivallales bacterium]
MKLTAKFFRLAVITALPSVAAVWLTARYTFGPGRELIPPAAAGHLSPLVFLAILAAIALLLLLAGYFWLRRQVLRPLRRTTKRAAAMARGEDETEAPSPSGNDEMAELNRELGFIRDRMQSYLSRMESSRERENNIRRKAESAGKIRGSFLNNISLELKNPLTAIIGFTSLLRRELTTWKFTESKIAKCDIILADAAAINSFFDKLATLSLLGSGACPLCPREIRVSEFLQAIEEKSYRRGENRQVTVSCRYSTGQPETILSDPDLLGDAIAMLLGCIVRNSPSDTTVTVECTQDGPLVVFRIAAPPAEKGQLDIAALYRKHYCHVIGIRPADISGIDMLDLALVKSRLDLLHARVSVDGPLAEGDTFNISFNVEDILNDSAAKVCPLLHYATNFNLTLNGDRDQPQSGPSGHPPRAMNVMLLGNDRHTSMLLGEMLSLAGHQFDAVRTRRECLEQLGIRPYDLLLIDMRPPYSRYLNLIRQIAAWPSRDHLHVIIMAPGLTDAEKEPFALCGIDECVFKPFDVEQMDRRFQEIAAKKRD